MNDFTDVSPKQTTNQMKLLDITQSSFTVSEQTKQQNVPVDLLDMSISQLANNDNSNNYNNSNEPIIVTIIRNYYKFAEKRKVYNFVYI